MQLKTLTIYAIPPSRPLSQPTLAKGLPQSEVNQHESESLPPKVTDQGICYELTGVEQNKNVVDLKSIVVHDVGRESGRAATIFTLRIKEVMGVNRGQQAFYPGDLM